ncbi:MAG: FtsX-like permease family protein [Gemmatimonadales bacterium]|nr:FtsX-like permease family protein [Gemmatimonadales bacterium]NIN11295.1 FtsX-like permease family protein [Gemmatimonadales bacterium]NIN49894.1 FtsX-like permease family protein [Gemmatimonadales bacterium]NIP07358.1 FtsX-like permease family protein [Gemmatimonadales bacterium]NIR03053.1 FtsX-like permease family protein [Gemmatimonadales bacterium]
MTQLFEGVGIALASLRASKVRAALTILGVAIGVMVVMVIGSMITGINRGVEDIFNQLGPRTFFVFRFFQAGIQVSDGSDEMSPWRRNPPLTVEEADRIAQLPTIHRVVVDEGAGREVEHGNRKLESVSIRGRGARWAEVSGDIMPGRSFTNLEYAASSRVVVVNEKLASEMFGLLDPIGKWIKISGVPFEVIGVYIPPPDIFGEGNRPEAVIPHSAFSKYIPHWRGWMDFLVTPKENTTVQAAIEDVTAVMRSMRELRPAEENNFAIVTQDKLLDSWNQVTGMFFLVMIALSSVGLMVGGVGVVAIMMISVTERTREIGVRKALGAKRREILWQFLVEAATLTAVGGAIGMLLGGGISFIVANATPLPAKVPMFSVVAALGMSILTGVAFGLYPAARAARLDPVEALRYE